VGVFYIDEEHHELRLLHTVLDVSSSSLGSERRISVIRNGERVGLVSLVIDQVRNLCNSLFGH